MKDDHLKWTKVSEQRYSFGHRNMIKKVFTLPFGNQAEFDVVDGGNIVTIFALTRENKVILVKTYRPAQEQLLLELPGGGVGPKEKIIDAAKRELLEETGYTGKLKYICSTLENAYNTGIHYNFVAQQCQKIQNPKLEDNGEPLEIQLMAINDFIKHLYSGRITDFGTGFLALHFLKIIGQQKP